MRAQSHPQAGFTLAELLTVIVIITALAGLILTALPRIEALARSSACSSNLRQIGQGIKSYTLDWSGAFPPLIYPAGVTTLPALGSGNKVQNPWYYQLMQKYGMDERIFRCPADKNYDPSRQFSQINDKLGYMSDNMSYGFNCDVKFANGTAYRVNASGTFVDAAGRGSSPSGSDRYPDFYRISDVEDPRTFIVAADSNSEFSSQLNLAISVPIDQSSYKIGTRHRVIDRPGANVLFADDHIEGWASLTPSSETRAGELAKDINQAINRRLWTLPAD